MIGNILVITHVFALLLIISMAIAIAVDITHRKKASEALIEKLKNNKEAEEVFDSLCLAYHRGIQIIDDAIKEVPEKYHKELKKFRTSRTSIFFWLEESKNKGSSC